MRRKRVQSLMMTVMRSRRIRSRKKTMITVMMVIMIKAHLSFSKEQ